MSKARSSMTVARPRPPEYAPRDTQRARSRSPTRPGSTLFTATPATTISTNRRCPSRGVGDPPPPRRLQPVDRAHARHRAEQRQRPDAGERAPHGAEIGSADRENEEDDRDRDSDRSRDDERAAAAGSRAPPAAVESRPCDTTDESGTTVTVEASSEVTRRGHRRGSRATLAHRPDRRSDARAKIVSWLARHGRDARPVSDFSPTRTDLHATRGRDRGGAPGGKSLAASAESSRRAPSRSCSSASSASSSSPSSPRRSSSATPGSR